MASAGEDHRPQGHEPVEEAAGPEARRGRVRGESVFAHDADSSPRDDLGQMVGHEPTPEFVAQAAEQCQRLLGMLPEDLRGLAQLKLQGYSNGELADHLGVVERTVERKLNLIRKHWSRELDA